MNKIMLIHTTLYILVASENLAFYISDKYQTNVTSRVPFQNAKEKPRSCRLNGKCHPVIARLYSNSGLYINSRKKIIGIDSMTVIPNGDTQGLNYGISRRASMALHVVNMTVWMLLCKIKHERRSGDYGRSAGGTTNAPTQIPNKR